MNNLNIKFDKNNRNLLLFYKGSQLVNMMVIPPVNKGCDIIDLNNNGFKYKHKSNSLIVITTEQERVVYHDGDIIYKIKR